MVKVKDKHAQRTSAMAQVAKRWDRDSGRAWAREWATGSYPREVLEHDYDNLLWKFEQLEQLAIKMCMSRNDWHDELQELLVEIGSIDEGDCKEEDDYGGSWTSLPVTKFKTLFRREFLEVAAKALRDICAERKQEQHQDALYITSDDVWDRIYTLAFYNDVAAGDLSDIDPRAMGAVMRRGAKDDLIVPTNTYKPAQKAICHYRPQRVWRVL